MPKRVLATSATWNPAARGTVSRDLVITENNDLLDAFFVILVAFEVFQAVLFLIDMTRVTVVRVFRWFCPWR